MSRKSNSIAKRRRWLLFNSVLLVMIVAATIVFFYVANKDNEKDPLSSQVNTTSTPTPIPTTEPTATPPATPQPPEYTEAVWIGVGDIMSHTPQLPGAYDKASDTYNFDPFFNDIAPYLEDGDWVMANLETPVAGKDIGYSGYPTFNAPNELTEALWNAGFNVLSTANNHTLDKGEKGVLRTLEQVHKLGFTTVGSANSFEARDELQIVEHNQISMGFLSYTYGTNGIPIPQGKEYLVNLIDKDKMIEDMKRLRAGGADIVTIALHFGNEYQTTPSEEQKALARELIAAGADIIAGSHPHVLQPYEVITSYDEQGNERQGVIIYSMGNFISNQRGESKDYGALFKIGIRKELHSGAIELTDVEVTPTWVHRYKPDQYYRYRIIPVEATIASKNDPLLKASDFQMLESDFTMLTDRLQSMLSTTTTTQSTGE